MDHIYDVIILGAGPAGLSAGLYAGRSRLDTLIIEKGQAGGQIINTDEIENYPGQIVEGETGVSLVRRMYEQTEQFGAEHVRDTITNAELSGDIKVLTGEKDTYQAKNIIIATGAYARPIGCKGEQEYKGRGISYCATCDANFFTDLEVYVAGGGDAAVEEALYLTKIEADPKDGLFGLFGFIGMIPNTSVFADKVETDDKGYIKTDEDMHTNVPGVYAVGDVRVKSLRQVVTAVADGAIAAVQVERSMSDY